METLETLKRKALNPLETIGEGRKKLRLNRLMQFNPARKIPVNPEGVKNAVGSMFQSLVSSLEKMAEGDTTSTAATGDFDFIPDFKKWLRESEVSPPEPGYTSISQVDREREGWSAKRVINGARRSLRRESWLRSSGREKENLERSGSASATMATTAGPSSSTNSLGSVVEDGDDDDEEPVGDEEEKEALVGGEAPARPRLRRDILKDYYSAFTPKKSHSDADADDTPSTAPLSTQKSSRKILSPKKNLAAPKLPEIAPLISFSPEKTVTPTTSSSSADLIGLFAFPAVTPTTPAPSTVSVSTHSKLPSTPVGLLVDISGQSDPADTSAVPLPPPPPPASPGGLGAPPPPPPPPGMPAGGSGAPAGLVRENSGMDTINLMRQRLNKRISENLQSKQPGPKDGRESRQQAGGNGEGAAFLDPKLVTWMEVQSRSRQMTVNQFHEMVLVKREEVSQVLERLAKETPADLGQLCDMVVVLQEAPEYFPGSSKELKATLPRFKELEGKIEDLCLFVQVTENILETVMEQQQRVHLADNKQNIKRWNDVLETKKRTWGDLVQTDAAKWREAGYPVPDTLISGARGWLFDLAEDLTLRTGDECQGWFEGTGQVTNDRVARRVKEIMENSRMTLRLIGDIVDLCGATNFDTIQRAMELGAFHIQLSIALFASGKVKGRVAITDHFEDLLKMLDGLKRIFRDRFKAGWFIFGQASAQEREGTIEMFEELGSSLLEASQRLCEFIAQEGKRDHPGQKNEAMLWLVFGCKFLHKVMSVSEKVIASEERLVEVLSTLQAVEKSLPQH